MPWVGFEHKFSKGERSQTYAIDRVATGIGMVVLWQQLYKTSYRKAEGGKKWDVNEGMTDKQEGRKTEGDRNDRISEGRNREK